MAEKWYNLTPEQIEARLSTDLEMGLNPRQATARLRREGKNTVYRVERPRSSALVWDVLRDPCAYMLLAAAVLAWIFNENVGAPVIIALTVFNALFVLAAYIKARLVIADAHEQSIPTATVIRGGKQYLIRQDRLCRGDIILLTKGDIVPADARLVESYGLCVIEAGLTGETGKKRKDSKIIFSNNLPPEKQADMVFATSVVSDGQAKAVVCETGEDTLACLLGRTVTKEEKKQDPGVLLTLKKHCSVWSLIMLVMVFVLTLLDFIAGHQSRSIFSIFITGLSIATAGMCEYYLVFGYIIIGCSMFDMSGRAKKEYSDAVVKNVADLDKLSELTTLVLPKEGGFTAGSIKLKKLYCDSVLYSPDERNIHRSCRELISAALDSTSYTDNDYEKTYNRFKARDASAEERAIYALARQSGIFDGPAYMASHIYVDRTAEDGLVRSMIATSGKNRLILRGDVEDVLDLCSHYRAGENKKNIKNEKNRVKGIVNSLSSQGLYAVGIATGNTNDINSKDGFVFEGFLVYNRPHLSGAESNIRRLQDAGINVIMLCEDGTNRSYAKSLGIIDSDEQILTVQQMSGMSEELLKNSLSKYRLYEGLGVREKKLLLTLLRENGERVGYFGCSFDDITLIRDADVGFSSGITLARGNATLVFGGENTAVHISSQEEKGSGSEALKQVCDVIVSPAEGDKGGFNAIASAIARSRRALGSLYRTVRYLMVSQCARLFVFLYSAMLPVSALPLSGEYILTSVQLLVLGLVFDLGVVMAFAFKSLKGRIAKKQQSRTTLKHALFGVFWGVCAIAFPMLYRFMNIDLSDRAVSAAMFFGFLMTSLVTAFETVTDYSVFKKGFISNVRAIAAVVITAGFIAFCAFTGAFDCCMLTPVQWLLSATQPLCMLVMFEIYKLVKVKKNGNHKKA